MFIVTGILLAVLNSLGQVHNPIDTTKKIVDSTKVVTDAIDSVLQKKQETKQTIAADTAISNFLLLTDSTAIEKRIEPIAHFDSVMQIKDSAQYFSTIGDSAYFANRFAVAEKAYLQSLNLDAKNLAVYKKLGDCYVNMKRYGKAIVQYKTVNEIDNNDTLAISKLAELCFMQQNWAETIHYTLQCVEKKIGARNNYKLAKAYLQQEEYSTAAKYLQAASIDEPKNAEIPYMMGTIWMEMNDMEKAFKAYSISLELDSTNADRHYEIAMYHYQMNAAKKVVYHLEQALKYGIRNDNDTKSILGLSYIAVGEYDKGEALAKAVFAKKQMDKSFMNDVGYAYYGVRRYDDAIRWWDQILTIDKNNAKALYMIGMAFRKKGDDEKGSRLCDAAIALDPNLAGYKKQMMPPQGMGL